MKAIIYPTRLMVMLAWWLTVGCIYAPESIVTPAMVGHWEGSARIVVIWCRQKELPVRLDIHADGSVTGTVGDAKLTAGRFHANRGLLGRKLNLATDYMITANLDGPLVAAEGITRACVMIPLNFGNGTIQGGVNASGTMGGGKKSMWLAARSLKLIRSP